MRQMNKPPWLMYFPKSRNLHEFYDPLCRKSYSIELEELEGCKVCCTKGVWLLLYNPKILCLFFFNPFTRELINLPRAQLYFQTFAFSCDPTSPSCVVFTLNHRTPTLVAISTCNPGGKEWTTSHYQSCFPLEICIWSKFLFSDGRFYCLSVSRWIGAFDPKEMTWNILMVPCPQCPMICFPKHWWKGKFVVEHDGEIMAIYTCGEDYPIIFKLDQVNMVWEEVKTLDGLTLFVSFLSSYSRSDLPGEMRDSVYFPEVRFYGKRCISYSLKDCRYYPRKQFYDWGEKDPYERIWIDAPEDLSMFK